MDGIETLNEINKRSNGKRVPIIALTGRAMLNEKEEILNKGFDNYVSKPVDIEKIELMIEKYIKLKDL